MDLIARRDDLRPVDGGRRETASLTEQLTPLPISISVGHQPHAEIRSTGL